MLITLNRTDIVEILKTHIEKMFPSMEADVKTREYDLPREFEVDLFPVGVPRKKEEI
jgi:hypothetical protein